MLVQVCPQETGGVRDYADCLAREWAARGVDTRLLEGERGELQRRLEALLESEGRLAIVLHFSGYGYAARGLCGWLADALSAVMSANPARVRLVVVFHELFAGGPPWRSAFWLSPWQSQVARRLASLADSVWTNTQHHAAWLRRVVGDGQALPVHPVFSNIGEATDLVPWRHRSAHAVVFGSSGTRRRAFVALRSHAAALERLRITEIVEAGDGDPQADATLALPAKHLGRLSTSELGGLLARSRFAILDYPARYLGKSGVFAAYAAHGCAVVNTFALERDADGLRLDAHYLNVRAPFTADVDRIEAMATRLHHWYGEHSLALQARELLELARGGDAALAPRLRVLSVPS